MPKAKLLGPFEVRLDGRLVRARSRPAKSLLEGVRQPGWDA
jgi:hypothetical protein